MNLRPLALLGWLAAALSGMAQTVTEPPTTFYGKILGIGGERPYLLTSGTLEWLIERTDGSTLLLHTQLDPVPSNGAFSYRLDVPHEALAQGLTTSGKVVALGGLPGNFNHVSIRVDDLAATITGPSGASFDARQTDRAATYRLDLEVGSVAADSDGDGIPDWWEVLHGLDPQDPSDAGADPDGDGLSNLQEFRRGTDPNNDNREPEILTGEILAYAGVTTGVILEIVDIDSNPAQLAITLGSIPATGSLRLRDGGTSATDPDRILAAGDAFTYEDVRRGRLIYVHGPEEPADFASFDIIVADEDPEHTAAAGVIRIAFYHPDETVLAAIPADEQLAIASISGDLPGVSGVIEERLRRYILAKNGSYVAWESSATSKGIELASPTSFLSQETYLFDHVLGRGQARPQTYRGSAGEDILTGGMERDILEGGGGNDTLTGKGGADDFVITPTRAGAVTITDFTLSQGDRVVIAGVKGVGSRYLSDHLRLRDVGGTLTLETSPAGNGSGFTGASATLEGVPVSTTLRALADAGAIVADGLVAKPYLSVTASKPKAYEGGESGEFLIHRGGDLSESLTVRIAIAGSATSGTDYEPVPPTLTFPAGAAELAVAIHPYPDSIPEPNGEIVALTLIADPAYDLGAPASAQVTIHDPTPFLTLEPIQPVASVAGPIPGSLLLRRNSAIDRNLLVQFTITGSATNGIDYDFLSSTLSLAAGEDFRLITIQPKPAATLTGGAEVVRVTLKADPSYLVGATSAAEVTIVPAFSGFDSWAGDHFNGLAAPNPEVADPGACGATLLLRYAMRLDPLNPSPTGGIRYSVVDGYPTIEFDVQPGDPTLRYLPEISRAGSSWLGGPQHAIQILPANGFSNPWKRTYRSSVRIDQAPSQLLRVRIQKN